MGPIGSGYFQHWGILLLGFGTLAALLTVVDHGSFADDGMILEFWPALYGMIQLSPFVLLECVSFSQFKLMRANNADRTRRAELRPRRSLDAVSPWLLMAAVGAFVATIGIDLYLHDFDFRWGRDTLQRAAVLTLGNAFMVSIGLWQPYGRKPDPYQSYADRARQNRAQWTSLLSVASS